MQYSCGSEESCFLAFVVLTTFHITMMVVISTAYSSRKRVTAVAIISSFVTCLESPPFSVAILCTEIKTNGL